MSRALLLPFLLTACDSNGADPVVVRYAGPEITEADATPPDEGSAAWSAEVVGEAVSIVQRTSCGDGCFRAFRLDFSEARPGALPDHVEATARVVQSTASDTSPAGEYTATVEVARVEIQDWGPEVYSGVVLFPHVPYVDAAPPPVFWTDDVTIEAE